MGAISPRHLRKARHRRQKHSCACCGGRSSGETGTRRREHSLRRYPTNRLLAFLVRLEWTEQGQVVIVEDVPSGLRDPEQVDVFSRNVSGCELLHDGVYLPAQCVYFALGLSEAPGPKAFF